MDGEKLIRELLFKIYQRYHLNDDDFEEKLIGDDNISLASKILKSLVPGAEMKSFLARIESIIALDPDGFLNTTYTNTGSIVDLDFSTGILLGRNRNFYFSDTNFGFASSLSFFDGSDFTDFTKPESLMLWKQIENYLERSLAIDPASDLDAFFTIIESQDRTKGILINKTGGNIDTKRVYGYIYLYALNFMSKASLDKDLYSSNRIIDPALTFNSATTYEQFIDVLDVLNDVKHTVDILSKFLKIYHVLEYLTYRVALSKIVSEVDQSKSFIRKVLQLSDNIKKSERQTFINNFKILFRTKDPIFNAKLTAVLTPGNRILINEKYFEVNFNPGTLKHVGELVYGIRCSIVHNKESEFHINLSNPDDYRELIPVIKVLIEYLEELIVEKVSTNDPKIQYSKPQMEFY